MSIRRYIQDLATNDRILSIICTVSAVHGNTIDVVPVNGDAEIYDVRLQASEVDGSIKIVPMIGSYVIVTMINDVLGYVTGYSDVDNIGIKIQDVDMATKMDELIELFNSIIEIIQNLKVVTPSGPSSGLLPDSMHALLDVKGDVLSFKRDLNSVLKSL